MGNDLAPVTDSPSGLIRAMRVHEFGGPEAITLDHVARPDAAEGQLLVRVKAAGVGPWDAWVRAGKSALPQPLPLILGSDLSGVVEDVGPGVSGFRSGDEVYGVTNAQFTGAYADYALARATMMAPKPRHLSHIEAASVPVVACTAWQMVYDHGHVERGTRVLVHGAAGNVGSYAVQLLRRVGADITATVLTRDVDYARSLGAHKVIDVQTTDFAAHVRDVDVVIDTIGGATLERSFEVLRPGGVLVSSVSPPDEAKAAQRRIRGVFFLVDVTTEGLNSISQLIDAEALTASVGEVLPLSKARTAHEMLAGQPHKRGKIVLVVDP